MTARWLTTGAVQKTQVLDVEARIQLLDSGETEEGSPEHA